MANEHGGRRNGAGRPKGSKNRRTHDVESLLQGLDMNPIAAMVDIYRDAKESGDFRLAGQMARELAQYVAPKRRAVDLSVEAKASGDDLIRAIYEGRKRARLR